MRELLWNWLDTESKLRIVAVRRDSQLQEELDFRTSEVLYALAIRQAVEVNQLNSSPCPGTFRYSLLIPARVPSLVRATLRDRGRRNWRTSLASRSPQWQSSQTCAIASWCDFEESDDLAGPLHSLRVKAASSRPSPAALRVDHSEVAIAPARSCRPKRSEWEQWHA